MCPLQLDCHYKCWLSTETFLPVFCVAICLLRAAVPAACGAEMVTGVVLSVGGAPCLTVLVASAVLSAPLRLILLVGTGISTRSVWMSHSKARGGLASQRHQQLSVLIDSPGLGIGLSPKPRPGPGPDWILARGVDWMAPNPGWIEGVLTTVGWRGVEKGGGMTGVGKASGWSSSSSRSMWAGWGSRDWDREDVELTSSKSS